MLRGISDRFIVGNEGISDRFTVYCKMDLLTIHVLASTVFRLHAKIPNSLLQGYLPVTLLPIDHHCSLMRVAVERMFVFTMKSTYCFSFKVQFPPAYSGFELPSNIAPGSP